jgi:hypothetical protein
MFCEDVQCSLSLCIFTHASGEKLHGPKFGEQVEWGMTSMLFVVKKSLVKKEM